MVGQDGTQVVAEAETIAARAWEGPPDSATYLLWSWLGASVVLFLWLKATTEFCKEVNDLWLSTK